MQQSSMAEGGQNKGSFAIFTLKDNALNCFPQKEYLLRTRTTSSLLPKQRLFETSSRMSGWMDARSINTWQQRTENAQNPIQLPTNISLMCSGLLFKGFHIEFGPGGISLIAPYIENINALHYVLGIFSVNKVRPCYHRVCFRNKTFVPQDDLVCLLIHCHFHSHTYKTAVLEFSSPIGLYFLLHSFTENIPISSRANILFQLNDFFLPLPVVTLRNVCRLLPNSHSLNRENRYFSLLQNSQCSILNRLLTHLYSYCSFSSHFVITLKKMT